jgi:hypothetical protein
MAEESAGIPILKYLSPQTILLGIVGLLTARSAEPNNLLIALGGGGLALAISLIYERYLSILTRDTDQETPSGRPAYDSLRDSLAEGGGPAVIYVRWLKKTLDRVDLFFGDTNTGGRAHASWLSEPAWTSPSFDRCLQLALIYPIAGVFTFWAWSGHVDATERSLGLPDSPIFGRVFAAGLIVCSIFLGAVSYRRKGWWWLLKIPTKGRS